MFITKKHLARRTFLKSAVASVSLPLLDAMIPASTALAQTAANMGPRMGFFYFPHGAVMNNWTPDTTGTEFELKSILAPLAKHKDYLTQKSTEYVYERLIREEFEMALESQLKTMEESYCE